MAMSNKSINLSLTLAAVDRMTHVINTAVNNGIKKFEQLQKKAERMATASASFAQQTATMGAAAGLALAAPVKAAIDFETAMLGVAKQVQGARDDSGKLTKVYFDMAEQVKSLTKEIPMTTTEIAEMVAAGARMGIASNELISFTKNAAKMATAFDLPAGELAEKMGKIAKIYNIPIPQIGNLADAINFLDDNAIAKGGDIIEVLQRIGGTAQQVKLGNTNAAALASTMLTLGASAEVAATGANALMRELAIATMQPKRFQTGLSAIGLDASQIQKSMVKDAQGTILKVLDAINKLPAEKQMEVTTQLFGKEYGDDIAKLAQGVTEYRRQLALLADPKLQGSMDREFQARLQSTAAQMQMLSEQVKIAAINFGTAMLPALQEIGKILSPIIESIAKFAQENPRLAKTIGMVTLGFAGLMITLSGIGFVASGIMSFFTTMTALAPIVGAAMTGISTAITAYLIPAFVLLKAVVVVGMRAITAAIAANPIGAIITAIAIAAWLIYEYWEPISTFFSGLWEKIKKAFTEFWNWLTSSAFFEAGANVVKTIADGIMSGISLVTNAISKVTEAARAYLPFSPAKEGAFKDLNKVKIVETIAQSINPAPLRTAMASVAMTAATIAPSTPAIASSVGGGESYTVNYSPSVTIAGTATEKDKNDFMLLLKQHEKDIIRIIRDSKEREQRLSF